ncbi:hypothetical protein NCCP1664_19580 [Zafaria cholistanensis]|uniref:Uncharacterized protein n=1 Tax=Zafaria cholistanensis TaxID=1682741 RepID=A0A5A7NTI1_9MICC|nr:hypothetical protein [Zafaria cholistanensis]GER23462.1 hypothetical protein NCCP1664_19580 [Zafaria cholistanensis]
MHHTDGADGNQDFGERPASPSGDGTARGEAPHQEEEGQIPVAGSEALAERIEKEADGDRDGDGEPDGPRNVPFPG